MKRIAFSCIAAALAGLFGLLLAEAGVRMIHRDITTTADNSSYFAGRWNRAAPPQLNQLGYRGRELPIQLDDGSIRVAVVGDSITYGQGLRVGERFTDQLEGLLNEPSRADGAPPFEVYNFGRPGAETLDQLQIVKRDVAPLSPSVLVLQWYVNDVESGRHHARPRPRRLIPSDRLSGWLHARSALYFLLNQSWVQVQGTLGWYQTYPDYMEEVFSDPKAEPAVAAQSALAELFREARRGGRSVVAVFFPDLWDDQGLRFRSGFLLDRALELCRVTLDACIDVRPAVAPIHALDRRVNRFDSHPSAAVNYVVARELADALSRLGLARRGRPDRTGLAP